MIGTARFRKGWPPERLAEITKEESNFNDLYWTTDEFGSLVARWMDNGLVFMVSTVHRIGKEVKRVRKRPRITTLNKKHVQSVWGNDGTKEIFIPTMIDDYNHWMLGVDVCDQRISYYHANLRCYRNWMPMMIQIMSMIRTNCYIIYKQHYKEDALSHKKITLLFIEELMKLARK